MLSQKGARTFKYSTALTVSARSGRFRCLQSFPLFTETVTAGWGITASNRTRITDKLMCVLCTLPNAAVLLHVMHVLRNTCIWRRWHRSQPCAHQPPCTKLPAYNRAQNGGCLDLALLRTLLCWVQVHVPNKLWRLVRGRRVLCL